MEERTIRIGVDVGGTNTDICAIDEKSGEYRDFTYRLNATEEKTLNQT